MQYPHNTQRKQVGGDKQMVKVKHFFAGVLREAKRVRWPKGEDLQHYTTTVLGYTLFFGLFLVLTDYLVIRLLQMINFR
jgi:preprotein translocase subunit SecE